MFNWKFCCYQFIRENCETFPTSNDNNYRIECRLLMAIIITIITIMIMTSKRNPPTPAAMYPAFLADELSECLPEINAHITQSL